MKKIVIFFLILTVSAATTSFAQMKKKERINLEVSIGAKAPLGDTKDDIVTGLSVNIGLGYKLTNYFELIHFAFDLGNSSPLEPDMTIVQDYYSYYGRMVMETITIYGFPLTTRLYFPVKNSIDCFIGAGGAYYWFTSKMEDAYYGNLKEPRKRHGFGPFFEIGLYTNFFSERWLFMLKGDFAFLETSGKSLSITESSDPGKEIDRTDKYMTISFGVRYLIK